MKGLTVQRIVSIIIIFCACIMLTFPATSAARAQRPAIAAAADLQFALQEIAARFQEETGLEVRLSFGSSGNFTHQIAQGAPFELFLSADENYIFHLAQKGLTADQGALYAIGRIVLFAPHGSPLRVDESLQDLRAAITDGRIKRFAIANPEHAPYGRAAQAALEHETLWKPLSPFLVFGENASQATQFAAAGTSQGGIIPLSLSKAPQISRLGSFALIPADWHAGEPLRQRMVLMKTAGDTARKFYHYLQQPTARDIFVRFGFLLADEDNH
ncbi:molybdenum ABC transporter substrate-binding protein [Geoalkalibacter subterraneus]|uniref:Molybdenum ABC transporter substrate-binding protein n=2 Tax=Geoalkalibacter subterraneus TaxID=483547 RepID=A0A0B5FTV7_9BACT|nr:molybdenum ABC transporter substrate-binding protein [Geoalkalibacter subterraneus]